jgi:hypothetical protein
MPKVSIKPECYQKQHFPVMARAHLQARDSAEEKIKKPQGKCCQKSGPIHNQLKLLVYKKNCLTGGI